MVMHPFALPGERAVQGGGDDGAVDGGCGVHGLVPPRRGPGVFADPESGPHSGFLDSCSRGSSAATPAGKGLLWSGVRLC
jgi:hypothetical protein